VGLHCCGDANWGPVLGLGLDVLSIDAALSLESVLACGPALEAFEAAGGRLALGVVPTNLATDADLGIALERVLELFAAAGGRASAVERLDRCLLTPACGLALRSIPDCERVFEDLAGAQAALREATAA
jgi:hypothetical protein